MLDFSLEDIDLLKSKKKKIRGYTEGKKFWSEEYLWKASKGLPVKTRPVEDFLDLEIKWTVKTVFDVGINVKKVLECDLSYPIILNAKGIPMDGYHRIVRTIIEKIPDISYVQFEEDPKHEKDINNKE